MLHHLADSSNGGETALWTTAPPEAPAISAVDRRRSDGLWTVEDITRVIGRFDLPKALVVDAVVSRPPVREIDVWEVRIDPSGSVLMHALPGAVCPGTSGASGGVWCIWRDCGRVLNQELFLPVDKSRRLRPDPVVATAHWRETQLARLPGRLTFCEVAQDVGYGPSGKWLPEELRLAEHDCGVARLTHDRVHLRHRLFKTSTRRDSV